MSERAYDENFEQLAAGYFDEVLDDAQLQQLKQLLAEDDRYVKRFAELAQLHQMIESEITYQKQAQRFHLSKSPNDSGAANALAELASLYEDGLQDPINFAAWREEQASKAAAQRQRVQRKRLLITSAIAAVLALAGLLAFQFIANTPAPQTLTDNTPTQNKLAESAQPIPRDHPGTTPVATLTATHNAQWGRPASAGPEHPPKTGSNLHPNDRLTLTAGFAEITTARGAIAILQAPATIELINNNALHLHAGKLVGICPTITSRGFTIETPAAQVVDIGTRFGVAVEADGQTAVEVFAGEVTVAPVIDGQLKPATRLLTRQAAKVTHGKVQPVAASLKPAQSRFAEALAFAEADPDTLDVLKDPAAIAHYSFDQPGGDTLPESRGQALFDAQIIGAQWTQGPHPGTHALNFTGKGWDERVVLSDQASDRLDLQGDFTIALWVNLRTCPDNGWSPLLTKGSDAWRILAGRDRKTREPQVGFYWSQSEDKPGMRYAGAATGDQDIELNRWHHLIVTGQADDTGEGATIRLYLDGQLKAENAFPRRLTSDSPVAIGAVQLDKGTLAFNGRLGEVAFLSRAISEDEVGKLYTPIHTPPQ